MVDGILENAQVAVIGLVLGGVAAREHLRRARWRSFVAGLASIALLVLLADTNLVVAAFAGVAVGGLAEYYLGRRSVPETPESSDADTEVVPQASQ